LRKRGIGYKPGTLVGYTRPGRIGDGTPAAESIHEAQSWMSPFHRLSGDDGSGVLKVLIRLTLAALIAFAISNSAEAGLFRKPPRPDAATYVPKLAEILKASTDDHLRVQAANELRDYDAKAYPEVLPALIDALSGDTSESVRIEAAESIGKVRPVTAQAGYALEQASSKDKSILVRLAAKRALLHYRLLGVLGKEDLVIQTAEPPLATTPATAKATPGSVILRPTPSPIPVSEPVAPPAGTKVVGPDVPPAEPKPGTFEPPLAEPKKPATIATAQPKLPTPIITIPPPAKDVVVPVPTSKPEPKELPSEVSTPEKPVKEGPTLPPPPKQ
jgi:HEAT repeats